MTILWNEVVWNEVVMERSDRIPKIHSCIGWSNKERAVMYISFQSAANMSNGV